ncbi:MAG: FGGY family carbohydrate kinase [Geminicoccaceae bacterium]
MRIAAIDQGTTSTRLLVVADGVAEIRHAVRHRQEHPRPGWVEHDALELLANVQACAEAAGAAAALGLDNQGESCLAWDGATGEPLSPVIVWQDSRTTDTIERLRAAGAEAVTLERAGLPLDPYFSASKLAWLAREVGHRPSLRLGTTDAWFLDRLTGRFVTDVTTASRTSLMNLATCTWDEELCRLFGVPLACLPDIHSTVGDFGGIAGMPLTAAVVDQQAALYGHGCRAADDAKITFGTGAFALALTGGEIVRAPERGLLPTVAWRIGEDTVRAVDGGVYDAGSAVEWAARLGLLDDLTELDAFSEPPAIERGLVFVPALSGLACPHWDRSAGALWLGMTAGTTRRDLCQALLEGIALRTAEVVAAMAEQVGLAERLSIDGGLARSGYFAQFLANATGRTILRRGFDELTALGCAALAARGLGESLTVPEVCTTAFEPSAGHRVSWRERFADAVARSRRWRQAGPITADGEVA